MNMKEKLIELLDNLSVSGYSEIACHTYKEIFADKIADYLIANDVVVQKHGEWLKTGFGEVGKCSCCGECSNVWKFGVPEYCPKCGAKMDGGKILELKPCPFCGTTPSKLTEHRSGGIGNPLYSVKCECSECRIKPSTGMCQPATKAVEVWNRRVDV